MTAPPGHSTAASGTGREPRAAIALAAVTGMAKVESILGTLHRRGHGI